MQITNTLLARTAWFLDINALNPLGLALGPIHSVLIQKYKFLAYPTSPYEFDLTKGVKYLNGEFEFNDKKIGIAITFFNNGWAADTLVSTEASDAFLENLEEWLTSLQFRSAKKFVTKTVHESQLVVTSDINIEKLSDGLKPIISLVAKLSGNEKEEFSGFSIGPETYPTQTFTFERRANTPSSEKLYYSRALMQTARHQQILFELERLFS